MKHSSVPTVLGLLVALLALPVMQPARAETDDYLKGYLDALLDQQFPDHDISVLTLHMERREAILTTHGCISNRR